MPPQSAFPASRTAACAITSVVDKCSVTTFSAYLQAEWGHLPSDVLAAIVLHQDLHTHKTMHLVCQQWTTAVRCNMHTMQPAQLHTEQLRMYFPSVRHLLLHKTAFQQNSTLCLAAIRQLQTLRVQECTFEACESIAELATLTGAHHCLSHDIVCACHLHLHLILDCMMFK